MSRIIVVDDERTVLQSLDILLASEGHEVIAFQDGSAAAAAIRSETFDLLITDIRMMPVNGMELIRLARQRNPARPCIVISAFNSDDAVKECYANGCQAFFPKPFNLQDVVAAVQKALRLADDE